MRTAFGLPHSSGPYDDDYDSRWDVMSDTWTCAVEDDAYGCQGQHTISVHKDSAGWITGALRYEATTNSDQKIFLERLALPTNLGNPDTYLTAQIPIGGSATDFYTLEARKLVGYEALADIPADAVIIHKVDTTLGGRNAQVVDTTDDDDPNDAGAQWTAGELFVDDANDISVAIVNMTDTGFNVIINPTVSDLSIEKTDSPDPVAAGTELTYSITVTNDGPDDAENVVVTDTLPPGVTFVSDTDSCVQGPPGTLTCDLGTITEGASESFDIIVNVAPDAFFNGITEISNTAEVTSDQFDDDTSNNDITIETEIISVADVEILSFTASDTPDELLIGDSIPVTLTKEITNNGPSSPVDVDVKVTTSATAGLNVDPAQATQQVDAVDDGTFEVFEEFTLTCTEPGIQEVVFSNEIEPVDSTDPDLDNNVAEVTVEFDCVIPVQINIHPASDPNSINILKRNGVIPVAILSTLAGEYGLPIDVDATMVNPLSVHFGPADVLFNVNPPKGATEFHNKGHIEDSFELDETTQDGDLDMVLHFKAKQTELDETDTEGCVKGKIDIGGMLFTFFGCDDIRVPP